LYFVPALFIVKIRRLLMPQISINIPEPLLHDIENSLLGSASPADFIIAAVKEKLTSEAHKKEFWKLSDQTRAAVFERGLTEFDVLKEFETSRHPSNG